jgi:hypothetical protein
MRSSYVAGLLVSLLSITLGACSSAEEPETNAAGQDMVATFHSYDAAKAFERLDATFDQALYQGELPSGEACTMTLSRDRDQHLIALSMGVFLASGLATIEFEVHPQLADGTPETAVSQWTDKTISLDFDVANAAATHVTILTPDEAPTSVKVTSGERTVECANVTATKRPMM